MREELASFKQQEQQHSATASIGVVPNASRQHPSPTADKLSQADFCIYLGENFSNIGAKARRRELSTENYLKTVAQERKGEVWEREPGVKGKWLKQSN